MHGGRKTASLKENLCRFGHNLVTLLGRQSAEGKNIRDCWDEDGIIGKEYFSVGKRATRDGKGDLVCFS